MARYKRDYFAKSNRGKFGEVFLHNFLARPTKGEQKQKERERRVQHLLDKYGLGELNPRTVLEKAQYEGISIDQVEKRVLLPIVRQQAVNEEAKTNRRKITLKPKSESPFWLKLTMLLVRIFIVFLGLFVIISVVDFFGSVPR